VRRAVRAYAIRHCAADPEAPRSFDGAPR
jgi:hypothetical protein